MTNINWEISTAYDLFISLHILHHPQDFGLRRAWANGVRSRLSDDNRDVLKQMTQFLLIPMHWIYELPEPKDSLTAINMLDDMPPRQRLEMLMFTRDTPTTIRDFLRGIADKGTFDDSDVKQLTELESLHGRRARKQNATKALQIWADAEALGEAYVPALREYYDEFFAEEEVRIRPVLEQGLENAQALSAQLSRSELLETLSHGIRYENSPQYENLTLAPSFWSTPLVIAAPLSTEQYLLIFGARPDNMSLVPGDVVPDTLHQALKALADPTRLRILRYLSHEPLTPAELARRLRLRPPTVSHHLRILRFARLVHFTVGSGDTRQYTVRQDAVDRVFGQLNTFFDKE